MTEEPQDRIPEALAAGIKGLALPKEPIPSRVDEAILAMAREELVPAEPDRSGWRLLRYGAVAAAVLVAFLLIPRRDRMDIDDSGEVNILDAFAIARAEGLTTASGRLDIDGDGVVNRRDVDLVAARAVRLGSEW